MFFSLKILVPAEEDAENVHEDYLQQVREIKKRADDNNDAEEFIEQPRTAGSGAETAREKLLRPRIPPKRVEPPDRFPDHGKTKEAERKRDRKTRPEKDDGDIEQSNPDAQRNEIF